jgi:hypothetical protein
MHPPRLRGSTVLIRPPDSEVEKYVAYVDECIAATNSEYACSVAPRLEQERERSERQRADDARRIADAQKKLDELG